MSNIIQLIPLMNQKSERELLNIIHDKNNNIDKNETQNGNTALMLACLSKNRVHLAMALITTGKSNIEHVNNDGDTALTIACNNSNNLLQPVVKALINTGQLNPGQANNNGDTALILACKNKLANIATMLIQTNQSKPEHVNNSGETALILACYDALTEVAENISDFTNSLGKAYMAGIMGICMLFLEVIMYDHQYSVFSTHLYIGLITVLAVCIYLYRKQVAIKDKQYLEGMVEHHSMALLTSKEILKKTDDYNIAKLAKNIIEARP